MTRRGAIFFAGLGLVLRLLAMTSWGTFDTDEWKAWSSFAVKEGLARVYGPPDRRVLALGHVPRRNFEWHGVGRAVDYPPGSMIVLWAEGKLYQAVDPAMPSDRRSNAVINLGPLLGSLAILALLWRSAPGELGRLRGLAFWLNPAAFLASPVLGYQDPIFGAFAVGAVVALMRRRYELASALVAAAGLVKPQGILLVPAFLAVLLREARPATWIRSLLAGLGVGTLVFLPWWSQGYLLSALEGAFRPLGESHLSALGLNLWWIAAYAMKWARAGPWPIAAIVDQGEFQKWAGFPPGAVAGVLLALGTAAALWLLVRSRPGERDADPRWRIPLAVILQVHVYAFCALSVHENHTLLAVFLAPLLLGLWPRARSLTVATSAFALVNLVAALRFGEGITTREWFLGLRGVSFLDAAFLVAAIGHGLLLLAVLRWSQSSRSLSH